MESKMKITEMPIEAVRPYDNNPRLNEEAVDAVADSIRNYGWQQPIVVDKDNVIIVGHTRRLAALKLALASCPVLVADWLTPEQVKAYRIDDNKTAEFAQWDFSRLQQEMLSLQEADYDLSSMAFSDAELARLLEEEEEEAEAETEAESEEELTDEEAKEEEQYDSQPGRAYRLGEHILVCGDSTEGADIQMLMRGDGELPVKLLLTDPPYNVNYKGRSGVDKHDSNDRRKNGLAISNDNMSEEEFQSLCDKTFLNIAAYMPGGASYYIFHSSSTSHNFRKSLMDNDFYISCQLIWAKPHFSLGWGHYLQKHEPVWYGWKNGGNSVWNGAHDKTTTTLQEWDIIQAAKDHPTPKPVDMLKFFIRNSSNRGDIVLDPFGGSGSTLIACEQTGRICRTMEIIPKYADVIRRRWAQFVSGKNCDWKALTPEIGETEGNAK